MSGSISSLTPTSTLGNTGTIASTGSIASAGTAASNDALASLSGNFNNFLNLLMTQIQNQDPTSPMDTSQFTTELVQFAGVEQQINSNTSLNQLISLQTGEETVQASSLVGHAVNVNSTSLPLQDGSATLDYTASASEPVTITVSNSSGNVVNSVSLTATGTTNSWTWDGTNSAATTEPDGTYTVAVKDGSSGTALPFTVQGTVTGVVNNAGTVNLDFGPMSTPFGNIASVVAAQ